MTLDLYFIINVFNVIIISEDNFICVLLYVIERVYRLSVSTLNTIIIICIVIYVLIVSLRQVSFY